MTVKEKLIYFSERGVSIAYISKRMNVDASTLTKWVKGQKGITILGVEPFVRLYSQFRRNMI